MAFPVTVVNPSTRAVPVVVTKPIQAMPRITTTQTFSYAIQPAGDQSSLNFGFLLPMESILETICYRSAFSSTLILTVNFAASVPPAVLGAVQGATIVPQSDGRFHFVLLSIPPSKAIAFTSMTNIYTPGQTRIDVTLATPDGSIISFSSPGVLTFQFHQIS